MSRGRRSRRRSLRTSEATLGDLGEPARAHHVDGGAGAACRTLGEGAEAVRVGEARHDVVDRDSGGSSRDRLFAQPAIAARVVLLTPRLGMGSRTEVEVMVTMRP